MKWRQGHNLHWEPHKKRGCDWRPKQGAQSPAVRVSGVTAESAQSSQITTEETNCSTAELRSLPYPARADGQEGLSERRRRTQTLTLHLVQMLPVVVILRQVLHETRQAGEGWEETQMWLNRLRNKPMNTDFDIHKEFESICLLANVSYNKTHRTTCTLKVFLVTVISSVRRVQMKWIWGFSMGASNKGCLSK